ncbi:MAG: LemA protein [Gaiellales bacterium]|jgi:LemA protein|nr:LemA protein [Gaiellales bacterium]MDX6545022.1 LemA protein [Gaiellales bacterium]
MGIALIIIAVIVILLIVFVIAVYNGMVRSRNKVDEAWSGIDVQLKRRHDLIPNLVESVKGYAAHERDTFQAVTDARTRAMSASGPAAAGAAEGMLSQALGRLFAVAEAYPQLRATENFQQLQNELTNTEDQIAASRRIYNGNVQSYNSSIQVFPNSIIAGMGGFTRREFFEIEDAGDREPVKVDFSTPPSVAASQPPASPEPPAASEPPVDTTPPTQG